MTAQAQCRLLKPRSPQRFLQRRGDPLFRLLCRFRVSYQLSLEHTEQLLEEVDNCAEELDKTVRGNLVVICYIAVVLIEKIAERFFDLTKECKVARSKELIQERVVAVELCEPVFGFGCSDISGVEDVVNSVHNLIHAVCCAYHLAEIIKERGKELVAVLIKFGFEHSLNRINILRIGDEAKDESEDDGDHINLIAALACVLHRVSLLAVVYPLTAERIEGDDLTYREFLNSFGRNSCELEAVFLLNAFKSLTEESFDVDLEVEAEECCEIEILADNGLNRFENSDYRVESISYYGVKTFGVEEVDNCREEIENLVNRIFKNLIDL